MLKKAAANEAVYVPSSLEEVNGMIDRYGEIQREVKRLETRLTDRVAKLRQATSKRTKPLEEEEKSIERSLKAYATKHYTKLFLKGKKHIKLAAGIIGWQKGRVQLLITTSLETLARRLRKLADPGRYFSIEIKVHERALLKDQPTVKGLTYVPAKNHFYIKPAPQIDTTRTTVQEPEIT